MQLIRVYLNGKSDEKEEVIEMSVNGQLFHWGQALIMYFIQNLPSIQGTQDDL